MKSIRKPLILNYNKNYKVKIVKIFEQTGKALMGLFVLIGSISFVLILI